MRKKGQVATVTLPLIALALSVLTLTFFALSGWSFGDESKELGGAVYSSLLNENYVKGYAKVMVREAVDSSLDDLKAALQNVEFSRRDSFRIENGGNLFGKIRNGEFEFVELEDRYKLEVEDLFVTVEVGNSKIKRNFDLCLEFDNEGYYDGVC